MQVAVSCARWAAALIGILLLLQPVGALGGPVTGRDDPSIKVLRKLDGKTIRDRQIKVIAYEEETCLAQSHLIFFATQNKELIQKVLEQSKGRGILTIGETEGFTEWGGVINFFEELNRLRFKVNLAAARREGLKMSSQILVSAQIVEEGSE
jgi:hypothetical protein